MIKRRCFFGVSAVLCLWQNNGVWKGAELFLKAMLRLSAAAAGGNRMNRNPMEKYAAKYAELVKALAPKSDMKRGLLRAFWVGGLICAIGQGIQDVFAYMLGWGAQSASTAASVVLILLSALLTGFGIYDRIGQYAGAGSIVPITGFANSLVIT